MRAAIARFEQRVSSLRRSGALDPARAAALQAGAGQAAARVVADVRPVASAPQAAPQPAPVQPPAAAPAKPQQPKDAGKSHRPPKQGKGNGKGKDHGHGEGGD